MNQLWKIASADPQALHFVPERQEVTGVSAGSTAETSNVDVFFPGQGFCFFSIEIDCVSFFNRDRIFGADTYAEAYASQSSSDTIFAFQLMI